MASSKEEPLVLKELYKGEFIENIESSLREDNISESCYTNFKDILVETVGQTIAGNLEKDGWKIKRSNGITMFNEKDSEKIFDAFMKNSEFIVTLKKKLDDQKYEFKNVVVKFDFSESEKKEIAKTYIDNILEGFYYLDLCLFTGDDEDDNDEDSEINVDTTAKILSKEVYHLLSPDEIKAKFKDKIEEAINLIFSDDEFSSDE